MSNLILKSRPLIRNKRLILVSFLIGLTAILFWSGSRYPALNEKAMMGGETDLAAIGFDTLVTVQPDHSLLLQILYNTINWVYTNKQGMTFGLLFGALLLTWLPLLGQREYKSRWANTLMGMVIGTPLGVCVNCAAPIAQGLYSAGAKIETTLATMVSSPTLNVVVVTMLFSLLPPYLAAIKLGLTIGFILIGIPLLTLVLPRPLLVTPNALETIQKRSNQPYSDLLGNDNQCTLDTKTEDWLESGRWVVVNLAKNLWHIVRITVPLMLLSGFLGSAFITLVPWDMVVDIAMNPIFHQGRGMAMVLMAGLGLMGIFLPVPMAFDVIITSILLQAGLPIKYTAVLLFTLGIFSVYSFLLVWRGMSRLIAVSLVIVFVGLGVFAGGFSQKVYNWDQARQRNLIFSSISQIEAPLTIEPRRSQGNPDDVLVPSLQSKALQPKAVTVEASGELTIKAFPFQPQTAKSDTLFSRFNGDDVGFNETDNFSNLKLLSPWSHFRGIAAGDVHNDGWSDIVLTADAGLALYANQQGEGYVQQQIDIPELNTYQVMNAALVDLNDDGWLDLYFSTYREGNYIIYNQAGRFTQENLESVPNQPDAILTAATAFGDPDQDGDLDMVLGNWSYGTFTKEQLEESVPSSRNVWLENQGDEFEIQPLTGTDGETLTTLLTDFNQDDQLDLLVGNDFTPPDFYYLGDGQGNFRELTPADNLIPSSTQWTMSLTTADLNNDLTPEIYAAHISQAEDEVFSPEQICSEYPDQAARDRCKIRMEQQDIHYKARTTGTAFQCQRLQTSEARQGCIAASLLQRTRARAFRQEASKLCGYIPDSWEQLAFLCTQSLAARIEQEKVAEKKALAAQNTADGVESRFIPQNLETNVLLEMDQSGQFTDRASDFGLEVGSWSWNAKFADLDNDQWQDLYMVNGPMAFRRRRESNYFYHNQAGETFIDQTEEAGLTSLLDTLSYVYTDMDNDGDLDIIAVPSFGSIWVYQNNSTDHGSLEVELRDPVGNHFGIGSKVIIHYGDNESQHQMREIQAGGGYLSFDAPIAHFGLGDHKQVDRIEVVWSTGERSEIKGEFISGVRYVISRNGAKPF
ncbi:MAG: FG-GAP-like repeat-containing protein [Cyanobacteria bacterium P01_F01_bin.116]